MQSLGVFRSLGGGEGRFQLGFGDFAGTQGAARGGVDIADTERRDIDDGRLDLAVDRAIRYLDRLHRRQIDGLALGHGFQLRDQVVVVAVGLAAGGFEAGQDHLDAVDRVQHQGDGDRRHVELAVAEAAEQGFAGVSHGFQSRQPQEPAGPLDCVDEAENVVERLAFVGVGLELDQFAIHHLKAFGGLGQEFGD